MRVTPKAQPDVTHGSRFKTRLLDLRGNILNPADKEPLSVQPSIQEPVSLAPTPLVVPTARQTAQIEESTEENFPAEAYSSLADAIMARHSKLAPTSTSEDTENEFDQIDDDSAPLLDEEPESLALSGSIADRIYLQMKRKEKQGF